MIPFQSINQNYAQETIRSNAPAKQNCTLYSIRAAKSLMSEDDRQTFWGASQTHVSIAEMWVCPNVSSPNTADDNIKSDNIIFSHQPYHQWNGLPRETEHGARIRRIQRKRTSKIPGKVGFALDLNMISKMRPRFSELKKFSLFSIRYEIRFYPPRITRLPSPVSVFSP